MDRRENIIARHERVLRRPFPESEVEDPQGEASEIQTASVSRRREQVLNAQRTHRQRTQQYIRELEKEVFRLRDENDEMRREMGRMRTQMEMMQGTSTVPFVPFEGDSTSPGEQQQQQQQRALGIIASSNGLPTTTPPVSVDLTALANVVAQASCENHPAELDPPTYQPNPVANRLPQMNADVHQLTTQQAINFILTLEQPCLPHIKHRHMGYSASNIPRDPPYNSGPGHLITATAMIAHRYKEQDLESSPIMIPSLEIEQLLDMSARLQLNGELTPVQIWDRIRKIARKRENGIAGAEVERLLKELEKYTYCNSFGAVVQRVTAEAVLIEVLGTA